MPTSLQDTYFAQLIQNQTFVLIYLKNGIKLTGRIIGHTPDVVFLNDPTLQLLYKTSISTIVFQ